MKAWGFGAAQPGQPTRENSQVGRAARVLGPVELDLRFTFIPHPASSRPHRLPKPPRENTPKSHQSHAPPLGSQSAPFPPRSDGSLHSVHTPLLLWLSPAIRASVLYFPSARRPSPAPAKTLHFTSKNTQKMTRFHQFFRAENPAQFSHKDGTSFCKTLGARVARPTGCLAAVLHYPKRLRGQRKIGRPSPADTGRALVFPLSSAPEAKPMHRQPRARLGGN